MIAITQWIKKTEIIQTTCGEISGLVWLFGEMDRINQNKKRQSVIEENKKNQVRLIETAKVTILNDRTMIFGG